MKNVLIVGASSGIGAEAAQQLAAARWRVFGTSRKPQPSSGGTATEWITMDVCDEGSVEKGIAEVLARVDRLDAIVCCAGYGIFGSVEEVSIEQAQQQLDTNYFGVLRVLRAVLPHMRKNRSGRVLLVGSLAGRAPIPFQSHYSSSKAAVDALSQSLSNEVRNFGIQVVLIEPGDIDTPFNDVMDWGETSASSEYRPGLESAEKVIRESLPKAPPPSVVASAIRRALDARWPRKRYAVGADSRLVPIARRLLPDFIAQWFIRDHFKL